MVRESARVRSSSAPISAARLFMPPSRWAIDPADVPARPASPTAEFPLAIIPCSDELAPGGWGGVGEVEIAVAEYIDWFNHRRLHGEIGHVPPVEYEAAYWSTYTVTSYRENPVPASAGTN